MASRCINPQCENQSSFFGAGALYAFQEHEAAHSRRHMRYLWLCASCAAPLRSTNRRRRQGNRSVAI